MVSSFEKSISNRCAYPSDSSNQSDRLEVSIIASILVFPTPSGSEQVNIFRGR